MDNELILKEINVILESLDNRQDHAYIFGVNTQNEAGEDSVSITEITHYHDVYSMLADPDVISEAKKYPAVLVTTSGWAVQFVPNEDDNITQIPPSQHPNRKRVVLRAMYTKEEEFATCVILEDEEPMFDDQGNGMLADAIIALYDSNNSTSTSKSIEIGSIDIDDEDADLF